MHGQFRQVFPLGDGSYIVPLLSAGQLIKLESDGSVSDSIRLDGVVPFSVKRLNSGNYLVSGGDGHCFVEVTPDGTEVERIGQHDLPGLVLGYVAQIDPTPEGGLMICNWLGHGADETQPHLIELDRDGKVVWTLADPSVGKVSAVYQYTLK